MNWLDMGLLLLIVAAALVGTARGFGRTAFDALGLYGALWLASTCAPLLAARLSLHAGGAAINHSWAFGLLFALFGAVCLAVAWYCHGLTQFQAGMFDKLLALSAGAAAGMILAHVFVAALVTADPQRVASAASVSEGSVGSELYSFPTYHSTIDFITGAGTYHHELSPGSK